MEDVETLDYIKTSVPKQEDSKWIREATRAKMQKELKAKEIDKVFKKVLDGSQVEEDYDENHDDL